MESDKRELCNLDLTACGKLVWYMFPVLGSNILRASYKLRLAKYSRYRVCSKEMYKCLRVCNKKASNKKELNNLESRKACSKSG